MIDLLGQLTRNSEGTSVRLECRYDTGPEDLWEALTSPARLRRWFAVVEGELREGGHYSVIFNEADPEQRVTGEIRTCQPPHRLVVSWIFPSEDESEVSVDITPEGAGTLLALEHKQLPPSRAPGYGAGWQTYLEQLSANLAGGDAKGPMWDEREEQLKPLYEAQLDG